MLKMQKQQMSTRARGPALTAVAGALLPLLLIGNPQTGFSKTIPRPHPFPIDAEEPCPNDGLGDLAPDTVSAETPPGETISIDVVVLLDGVTKKDAKALVAGAQEAYEPFGLELVPTFKRTPIAPDGVAADGQPTGGWRYLLREMRQLHPTVPENKDVIHLLTTKDVVDEAQPDREGTDTLAGMASCVGGIRFEGHEYSLTETRFRYASKSGPDDDFHAIVLAHEIAHLLGAHHHHGNCLEGRRISPGNNGSCTVMWPLAVLNSARFGTLEGRVVRGYAAAYAASR